MVSSCDSACWPCYMAGLGKAGVDYKLADGKNLRSPTLSTVTITALKDLEPPSKTAAVWHSRSEGEGGIQSCCWYINLYSFFINKLHLILIWWCTFTLSPSFNSSVMSFQHTWYLGDWILEVPWSAHWAAAFSSTVYWEELCIHCFCVSSSASCMLWSFPVRESSAALLKSPKYGVWGCEKNSRPSDGMAWVGSPLSDSVELGLHWYKMAWGILWDINASVCFCTFGGFF